jgi:hypothetical protein
MFKVGHTASVIDVQLAGRSAVIKSQTAAKSGSVTVAQLASVPTCWLKLATLSVMQVRYCATVALHFADTLVQLATAEPPCRQAASWTAQFFRSWASVGALLDTAEPRPDSLHNVAGLMFCPK